VPLIGCAAEETIMSWLQRPSRRSAALFVAGMLFAAPAAVLASDQFPDVPNSNPFHGDIGAIADAGITAGFSDGGYHPAANVTRQSMAAFLSRGLGHIVHDAQTLENSSFGPVAGAGFSTDVPVKEIVFNVPGTTNEFAPKQLVYLQGRVMFTGPMGPAAGCPCVIGLQIADITGNQFGPNTSTTFDSSTNASLPWTVDVDTAYVLPPGPRTFQLIITMNQRTTPTNPVTWSFSSFSTLTAMSFPIGETVQAD
jgi:hypothetical protein